MRTRLFLSLLFVLLLIMPAVWVVRPAIAADDWLPISSEELAMKDDPANPGAHALLLYREIYNDNVQALENHYYRIKIFREEGKKNADVEIVFLKGLERITDLKARTIRPDGSIVPFQGQVFEKMVVKYGGLKVLAKTFTFPEVQVGSIIEYRYSSRWERPPNAPKWRVQSSLPTRRARFSFKAYPTLALSWTSARLPAGVSIQELKGRVFQLNVENVPPFQEEDMMPPEDEVRMKVEFFYFLRDPETPEKFWRQEGQDWHRIVEEFIGKRKGVQQAANELAAPADPPEVKLRKFYARVQQIRNLSYEREKTEKEAAREKLKDNNNVEDVLKHGYGYRNEINRLFAALVRGAGMEANIIRLSERDVQFFQEGLLDEHQLDGEVTEVRIGAEMRYFDAGTPNCPFGMLAWLRTGVRGIRLGKDGGVFIVTPSPSSADSIVERKATLQLDESGSLQGKVQVSFIGQEAIRRRLAWRDEDEAGRKKEIEDEIKGWLPGGAVLKLENISGWTGFEEPLKVDASVEISGVAAPAGRRLLLPLNFFQARESHPFRHANRVHPVYLRSPYQEKDDISVRLPEGFKVESIPAPRQVTPNFATYQVVRTDSGGTLRAQRLLVLNGILFPVEYYSTLRSFFSTVRAGDEEQVVLRTSRN